MKVLRLLAVFAAGLALGLAGCGSDDGGGGGGAGTTTNGTTTEDDGYSRY
jgi:F0F1-type ATP synthase membrane subunit c/vacuolar-type H+-ATPase subunit K